eukprot:7379069-Prymnesium_polylepis.1
MELPRGIARADNPICMKIKPPPGPFTDMPTWALAARIPFGLTDAQFGGVRARLGKGVFSLLKQMFGEQQICALADYPPPPPSFSSTMSAWWAE